MGVKDLWSILSPTCEMKPIWELQGKTVAIDLSAWICDSQNVTDTPNVRNIYLRNLFFRTCYLLLLGVKLIFILEGIAPEIKHKTIKNRKLSRYTARKVLKPKSSRSRSNSFQNQCRELLSYMGVSCFHSKGEAEALCAYLNKHGIVDGIITQDSDSFLYGAQIVYRNFSINSRSSSTIEVYDISKIRQKLNLGREKLVALSLLCGCDYNEKGVVGVGKETALKFLRLVPESGILQRLSKIEARIIQKALLDPSFPYQNIQDEFLSYQHDISDISFEWKQPNVKRFMVFTEQALGWNACYALEKFLPIMARWHLLYEEVPCGKGILQARTVLKKRKLRGVPSYEVTWEHFDNCTIEPHHILQMKYSNLIEEYETLKQISKTSSKKGVKEKKINDITNGIMFEKLSISDDVSKLTVGDDKSKENDHQCLDNDNIGIEKIKSKCMGDIYEDNWLNESLTPSDFECSATDLLELSSIVESIVRGGKL